MLSLYIFIYTSDTQCDGALQTPSRLTPCSFFILQIRYFLLSLFLVHTHTQARLLECIEKFARISHRYTCYIFTQYATTANIYFLFCPRPRRLILCALTLILRITSVICTYCMHLAMSSHIIKEVKEKERKRVGVYG